MWVVLLFAGFVVVGLRDGGSLRNETSAVATLIVLVLFYVSLTRHLL